MSQKTKTASTMPEIEKLLSQHPHWLQVKGIARKLHSGGFEAVLAGGGIRDALLGKLPKDFDLAASAKPKEMLKIFPFAKIREKYGTAIIPLKNPSFRLEITAFRTESSYSDGRRPDSVAFASMEEDAQRRDFTVNALFYDIRKKKIIDFVEGKKDLKRKILRAVGDPKARFQEDRLRPLRALRLAHQLGFSLEKKTSEAIPLFAPLLKTISRERIADELGKMLSCGRVGEAMALLRENDFIGPAFFLPVFSLKEWPKKPRAAFWDQEFSFFGDEAFLWALAGTPYFFAEGGSDFGQGTRAGKNSAAANKQNAARPWGGGAGEFQKFLKRLKLSSAVCKKSLSYFQGLEALMSKKAPFAEKMKAFDGQKGPVKELSLAWLKCHRLSSKNFMKLLEEFEQREDPKGRLPHPLVTGEDLLQRGLAQGKALGRLLEKALAFQIKTPKAGKREILKRLNLPPNFKKAARRQKPAKK